MEITEGASINVTNWEDAVSGLAFTKEYSKRIIVEKNLLQVPLEYWSLTTN
jgi:hypothetical protein